LPHGDGKTVQRRPFFQRRKAQTASVLVKCDEHNNAALLISGGDERALYFKGRNAVCKFTWVSMPTASEWVSVCTGNSFIIDYLQLRSLFGLLGVTHMHTELNCRYKAWWTLAYSLINKQRVQCIPGGDMVCVAVRAFHFACPACKGRAGDFALFFSTQIRRKSKFSALLCARLVFFYGLHRLIEHQQRPWHWLCTLRWLYLYVRVACTS